MIAVADTNTLWRSKPFEALGKSTRVVGLRPRDIGAAWRQRKRKSTLIPGFECQSVTLPYGWASRWPSWTAFCLWAKIQREAKKEGGLQAVVVTSPHYLELARKASPYAPTFYYCSDDYEQYERWGGKAILSQEAQLVRSVKHSFFVSQVLANRAISDYGISQERVSVSPNATDINSIEEIDKKRIEQLIQAFPGLHHPLVGVVGAINDRLDFEAIYSCLELPQVGSLVMVGGVQGSCEDVIPCQVRNHPKCIITGHQPHCMIPIWMQAIDVALIPYRFTPLNHACSPMRLYDHLAAGKPVVATNACDQVNLFKKLIDVTTTTEELKYQIALLCQQAELGKRHISLIQAAQGNTWDTRARQLAIAMFTP